MKRLRFWLILAGTAAILFAGFRLLRFDRGNLPLSLEGEVSLPAIRNEKAKEVASPVTDGREISARSNRELAEFRKKGEDRGWQIVREDAAGLTLEIEIPEYRLEKSGPAGEVSRVEIPGYLSLEEPGEPALPALVVSVPLPGVETIAVSARTSPPRQTSGVVLPSSPGDERIRREISRLWEEKAAANPETLSPLWREFASAALRIQSEPLPAPEEIPAPAAGPGGEGEDWYPKQVVESSGPLWRGEEQFVNLRVAPVRYSGSNRTLESSDRVTVEIAYGAPAKSPPRRTEIDYGAQFELAASPDSFLATVTEDGIQIISYQDLLDAGFNVGQDPRSLRVYYRGGEVAVHVEGETDGTWDPGDYLAFYGEGDTGFYTETNTYWLYQTAGTGLRMEEVSSPRCGRPSRQESFLDRLHLEQRVVYRPALPTGENDCWFWAFVGYANGSDYPSNIQFTLDRVSGREGTVPFSARYFGYTRYQEYSPDHHTRVYLNGNLLGDFIWDGQVFFDLQTDIPQSYFQDGVNTITTEEVDDLGLPIFGEFIFVDHFDLSFYRDYRGEDDRLLFTASGKGDYRISGFSDPDLGLYEVTDPAAPRRLIDFTVQTGGDNILDFRKWEAGEESYWGGALNAAFTPPLDPNSPADLLSPRTVDYIIVTHPDFRAAIQPLADFRQAGGLKTEIFEVGDIYNTFGFGDFTPQAIQRFFDYAYTEWDAQTRPRYALLAGDGNYDYKNYLGASPPNYVPPYMFRSQYMETASDNWYGCLIGNDRVPDLDIGRLSITSPTQAAVMVQKIIGYQDGTDGLPWQRDILMVADNPDLQAGDFPADSNWLIENFIPPSFTAQTAYLPDLGLAATRTAIVDGINSGKLWVNYIGHGTIDQWSSPYYIFRSASIASLTNADRLHFLTTPTCSNGYWCDVVGSCLAEAMTRADGKGAIAAVSPSGLSLNTPARQLTGFLFEGLLTEDQPAGTALTEAKSRLAGLSPWLYMLDIYTLFGDPALELK
ncbi:MAG: C25 family cysteine peptidase [Candidatus Erginobacter occultus]|nr:C25 family cysteine peptidase [Candidatus Erginobacter occultus]